MGIMYASGLWNGYWEQQYYGRQPMLDFSLRFRDGAIEGEGRDIVGAFVITGEYDAHGRVRFTKRYAQRHSVHYDGMHDGEGTIHGRWSIPPSWDGAFALRPVRSQADPNLPIQTID